MVFLLKSTVTDVNNTEQHCVNTSTVKTFLNFLLGYGEKG